MDKYNPHKGDVPKPGSGKVAEDLPMLTSLGTLTQEQKNDGGAKGVPYDTGKAKIKGPFGGDSGP